MTQMDRSEEGVVRRHMLLVLEESEWNISRASRALGVTRRTVYERLRRWKVRRPRKVKVT